MTVKWGETDDRGWSWRAMVALASAVVMTLVVVPAAGAGGKGAPVDRGSEYVIYVEATVTSG